MGNKIRIKQIDLQGIISASGQVNLLSASNYVSFVTQLDTTMSSDVELAAVSSSISQSIYTINQILGSGLISGSSQLTSSYDSRYVLSGSITQTTWDNIANKPSDIVSSSTQISNLGFVTGSYTTINSFNSLTQSFNSISQSFNVISGSVGTIDFSTLATTGSNTFIGNQTVTGSLNVSGGLIVKNTDYSWSFNSDNTTTFPNDIIDGGLNKVEIKSSNYVEMHYAEEDGVWQNFTATNKEAWVFVDPDGAAIQVLRGNDGNGGPEWNHTWRFNKDGAIVFPDSTTQTTAFTGLNQDIVSSSQQITAFGFISSSTTIPTGTISGSSQLTSSFDTRYTLSGSISAVPSGTISGSSQLTSSFDTRYSLSGSSNINTSSFATTGSNSFSGSQTITGSLIVSSVAVVNGALTIPSASVISLTSGSSISVDASGAITGSLTGSVFGIGDVVAFSASLNSRIINGSSVAGTISGSSQLTSSFDTRYLNTGGDGVISGSSQLTSSFDTRYAISASFVSSSNLSSIQTITSASYAALTPVSGTLYIIIG